MPRSLSATGPYAVAGDAQAAIAQPATVRLLHRLDGCADCGELRVADERVSIVLPLVPNRYVEHGAGNLAFDLIGRLPRAVTHTAGPALVVWSLSLQEVLIRPVGGDRLVGGHDVVDVRMGAEALSATQTSSSTASRELLSRTENLLDEAGLPEATRARATLDYLGQVINAQAASAGSPTALP